MRKWEVSSWVFQCPDMKLDFLFIGSMGFLNTRVAAMMAYYI